MRSALFKVGRITTEVIAGQHHTHCSREAVAVSVTTRNCGRWNISLFHYCKRGSDCGRVPTGCAIAPATRPLTASARGIHMNR